MLEGYGCTGRVSDPYSVAIVISSSDESFLGGGGGIPSKDLGRLGWGIHNGMLFLWNLGDYLLRPLGTLPSRRFPQPFPHDEETN